MEIGELFVSVGDLLVSITLLLYFISGFASGMIKSLFGLVRVLMLATTLTLLADLAVAEFMQGDEQPTTTMYVIAVLGVSIFTWVVLWLLGLSFKQLIDKMSVNLANNFIGAVLGFTRGYALLMILLGLTSLMPSALVTPLWEKSLLLPKLGKSSQSFWQLFPASEEGFGRIFVDLEYDENYRPHFAGSLDDTAISSFNEIQRLNKERAVILSGLNL